MLLRLILALATLTAGGCGSGDDDAPPPQMQQFAVLGAFPGELVPHVKRAVIRETMTIDGHVFRIGTLDGVPVVLALTGIGLVNAASTTRTLLDHFDVAGIVVSAVAGTTQLRIADVAVPERFAFTDGTSFAPKKEWLDVARSIAAAGTVTLEHCTMVPSKSPDPVCFPYQPAILVGGVGHSSDPFNGTAFRCRTNGGEVYGCDVNVTPGSGASAAGHAAGTATTQGTNEPVTEDMETAAIAREAAARGVPYIAFRAVSDGSEDPLHLSGFLDQFNAYYSLAARNAALTTVAFLKKITTGR